jgi:hypothetical protein
VVAKSNVCPKDQNYQNKFMYFEVVSARQDKIRKKGQTDENECYNDVDPRLYVYLSRQRLHTNSFKSAKMQYNGCSKKHSLKAETGL